jgi:ketosteroid isomerase-like protein
MRGQFQGGVCNGHSHPVGQEAPRTIAPLCTKPKVAPGRYVLAGSQVGSWNGLPAASEVLLYEWEPSVAPRPAATPIGLVRAMWKAGREGDMDGVLATLHPDIKWSPLSRPGGAAYSGHTGVRQLRDETDRHSAIVDVAVDDVIMTADGNVLCRGRSTRRDGTTMTVQHFEATYVMRDGLIYSVETREVSAG